MAATATHGTHADITTVSILGRDSIHVGLHLSTYIAATVTRALPASTYACITDTHLATLHAPALEAAFKAVLPAGARYLTHAVAPGESTKSRQGKADVEDWLLGHGCVRDTVLIALGGGVIGDLIGFVAATFMRGVKVVQVPTTLLAMVDSSVGGKTAIDTPLGKNLIGAFWQPAYIFIDVSFLETLPEREFVNGMAEVIKTAAIWDEREFAKLENAVDSIRSAVLSPPPRSDQEPFPGRFIANRSEAQSLLLSVISASIGVKSHIVTVDERETGLRNLVNFGHTVGHAIEALVTPHVLHGECVAVGMVFEAEIARASGILSNCAVGRLTRCLRAHGLPTSLDSPVFKKAPGFKLLTVDKLLHVMKVDKKNDGTQKKVVLLNRIGSTHEQKASSVADDVIARILAPSVAVVPLPSTAEKKSIRMSTPGSKSISNRALVLAALAKGECRLKNLLHSDDTQVMMAALETMKGATFAWEDAGETLVVRGTGGSLIAPDNGREIYLGNAGTAARFLTTVCALVRPSALSQKTIITGNARMKQRPIGPLVEALTSNGSDVKYLEGQGCLPLDIAATKYGLKGGRIELAASISSQYVSSILLSAPYAAEAVELELVGGQVISQPYIDMTIAMMSEFGIKVERVTGTDIYRIPKGVYSSPSQYNIESDASSSTYPLAVAAITGQTCTILNIGNASLQGDARFAKEVLEPMGCMVVQSINETTVTGPPPGQLRALGEIDMEPMTDAFLTAAVLAAVATSPALEGRKGKRTSTRITGIANQRVKECNRIKAMMDELLKFGVKTVELSDGLEVFGVEPHLLTKSVTVHCYDDHRVAMAFSVLASLTGGPGCVLDEKRCVEKTWPSWWDDLSGQIGITVHGIQIQDEESASKLAAPKFDPGASILICGMRGSGKSFSGRVAATALGWPLIDTDIYFMERHKIHVRAFVKANGWLAFRIAETEILKELLETRSRGHVISLGGGVVESEENRRILKEFAARRGPIVEIVRDINDIIAYLDEEGTRPALGEPIEVLWERRQPLYRECANCEFFNFIPQPLSTQSSVNGSPKPVNTIATVTSAPAREIYQAQREMKRFFRFICGIDTNQVNLQSHNTYFLSLTFPSISNPRYIDVPALSKFDDLTIGCDAIELRVDLLSVDGVPPTTPQIPQTQFVGHQLSALRRLSTLPVVFTVRTCSQGGMFPDNAEDEMFDLLRLGLRAGCEYVDVEFGHSQEKTLDFCAKKGFSKVIASYHDWSGKLKWDGNEVRERYTDMVKYGDIIKIVSKATCLQDNIDMMNFRRSVPTSPALMTINMGQSGQMSRILNPTFSPVTHSLLPSRAAPGQLTFSEIQSALSLLGQQTQHNFYLFGNPITHSKSPLIHNTAFKLLNLPHRYTLFQTESVDDSVLSLIQSNEFGGASVTIPHKLTIIPYLNELTPHAKVIGAVNTIIPIPRENSGGALYLKGDNTDWLAIRELLLDQLPVQSEETSELVRTSALVIGAGGTSRAAIYALYNLGFRKIYLYNRSEVNAIKVAESFSKEYGIVPITSLEANLPGPFPSAIVSTVPASGTATKLHPNSDAGVLIPQSIFSRQGGGVALDMSYAPKYTPLLQLAQSVPGWKIVPGIDALLLQAFHQLHIWTGRQAPKENINKKVLDVYNQEQCIPSIS